MFLGDGDSKVSPVVPQIEDTAAPAHIGRAGSRTASIAGFCERPSRGFYLEREV